MYMSKSVLVDKMNWKQFGHLPLNTYCIMLINSACLHILHDSPCIVQHQTHVYQLCIIQHQTYITLLNFAWLTLDKTASDLLINYAWWDILHYWAATVIFRVLSGLVDVCLLHWWQVSFSFLRGLLKLADTV